MGGADCRKGRLHCRWHRATDSWGAAGRSRARVIDRCDRGLVRLAFLVGLQYARSTISLQPQRSNPSCFEVPFGSLTAG